MQQTARQRYNEQFTPEKYAAFLHSVNTAYGEACTFRLAETPMFVPNSLKHQLLQGVEYICASLTRSDFKA
ncbi:MAG: hypothetical protein ABIO24_14365, partial [Saprospiraceae bacterium]